MENFNEIFLSIASLAAFVIGFTQLIKSRWNVTGLLAQALSWIVAAVFSFLGWFLQIGVFEGISVMETLFIVLNVALSANGGFKAFINFKKAIK